ncbi:glutathione peroxidase [Stappia stellulata]|uniref:glutathione peroxidase n=1 Tax=Stappia stellulata TaxID=71235 RepID=UPI0003F6EC8B|nr:glutathione peroxidase [Stappia stellulata]
MFSRVVLALMLAATTAPAAVASDTTTAHDFTLTAIDGSPMPLSAFKGKTVLVVNTASRCSFTKQYAPLQALYEAHRDEGLVVIGVPSNDFGGQEPGTEADIEDFTQSAYRVDFPLTNKTAVVGDNASPFYKWASEQAGPLGKPRWNFHKYLIGPDGRLIDWYTPMTAPGSPKLRDAIVRSLAGSGAS